MALMDNIPNTLGRGSHSKKRSHLHKQIVIKGVLSDKIYQVDCWMRQDYQLNFLSRDYQYWQTYRTLSVIKTTLIDISHTVRHQDYTVRHTTQSDIRITLLDMSHTARHQDYTVRNVAHYQSSGLLCQTCHTLSVIRTALTDMSHTLSVIRTTLLDMSHTVSQQDYTVSHVTLSVIRTTRLDMSYIVSHQDYTVRRVAHCRSSGLHCQTCHTLSGTKTTLLDMSHSVSMDYTVRHVFQC